MINTAMTNPERKVGMEVINNTIEMEDPGRKILVGIKIVVIEGKKNHIERVVMVRRVKVVMESNVIDLSASLRWKKSILVLTTDNFTKKTQISLKMSFPKKMLLGTLKSICFHQVQIKTNYSSHKKQKKIRNRS